MACNFFNLKPLTERRLQLSTNFALKLFKSDRSEQFFTHRKVITRCDDPVVEKTCNTLRCWNAPHSYLSRLVNQNKDKLKPKTKLKKEAAVNIQSLTCGIYCVMFTACFD